ncbi:MAG TPA: hypothetical protein VFU35_01855 [Jatrophihabitans sp.]|nr:hypothetical protein [Jatrophihabitans sp.]
MLIGLDEHPYHQITASFAGVAGSDPQWNDGHYVCAADQAGNVSLTSNLRLYSNNDVLDGFVCIRHQGRQHNIRLSRRLRPNLDELAVGPLRIELVAPMRELRLVLDDNEFDIALDLTCRGSTVPYEDPAEVTRVDGRLVSERITYELAGKCAGWVRVGDARYELDYSSASFFRNHSWGYQAGRGGPRLYAAPGAAKRRLPGVRQWVLFDMPEHSGFYFVDPSGRSASGKGAIMLADRVVPVTDVEHELEFYEGNRRLRSGRFQLTAADGVVREYAVADLGWVYCQGGGYFGGFNDGLGQGVYRGDYHVEGEVWDVSHPTQVVDASGKAFEFDHAWAENFTLLTSGDARGLAHFECVVIRDAQDWSGQVGAAQ